MESLRPEALVRKSFYAFQRAQHAPTLFADRDRHLASAALLAQPDDDQLHALARLRSAQRRALDEAHERALTPTRALRFLQPGRVVRIGRDDDDGDAVGGAVAGAVNSGFEWGWGMVVGVRHAYHQRLTEEVVERTGRVDLLVDVLLACAPGSVACGMPMPAAMQEPTAEAHVGLCRSPECPVHSP